MEKAELGRLAKYDGAANVCAAKPWQARNFAAFAKLVACHRFAPLRNPDASSLISDCRRVLRASLIARPLAVCALLAAIVASPGAAPPGAIEFEDITANSGIEFVLRNGAVPGEKHQIETMLGGVALFDYDGDGLLDIFLANGALQPGFGKRDPRYWNRLYRNRGNGVFEDVTAKAGVAGEGYSMGVAAADYDNDGHPDLFVAGVGRNILYHNRGDGTFEDVTAKAGIRGEPWSVAAGWFDADGDGQLDLFVVNYVAWDAKNEPSCRDPRSGALLHCHPDLYSGLPNTLYHNNGDGTFTDVSESAGIRRYIGKGMGVAFADYDGDGRIDILVTNDTLPNFLFHNEGNGRFREVGLAAGVAVNDDGRTLSSMGVDFRDVDNDGRPDLFLTAIAHETYPLYRNLGKGLFADFTYRSRVGAATVATTGWSNGIYDFNNDGRKDLFAVNGDLNENADAVSGTSARQHSLALVQRPDGTFDPVPAGPAALNRGAAFGDFDNDGRIDVVISRLGEKPALLRNITGGGNHWLGLKLIGHASNRDAIGATVHIRTAKGEQWNHVTTSVGYASSSDVRVHFGLGAETRAAVEIHWPSGAVSHVEGAPADRYLTVREPE
ncbi:ASPIC/UnbV domain protein [Candidatus Sulfopaludibacter sp. SbA3]|nr:ASPIC/UnbV domain protein [Candidatus Sulfopaludibacter sp. SbA3]